MDLIRDKKLMQIPTWKETLKIFLVEECPLSFLEIVFLLWLGVVVGVIQFCGSNDRVETIQEKNEYIAFYVPQDSILRNSTIVYWPKLEYGQNLWL